MHYYCMTIPFGYYNLKVQEINEGNSISIVDLSDTFIVGNVSSIIDTCSTTTFSTNVIISPTKTGIMHSILNNDLSIII